MASYGMLQGLTGVRYDAVDKTSGLSVARGEKDGFVPVFQKVRDLQGKVARRLVQAGGKFGILVAQRVDLAHVGTQLCEGVPDARGIFHKRGQCLQLRNQRGGDFQRKPLARRCV